MSSSSVHPRSFQVSTPPGGALGPLPHARGAGRGHVRTWSGLFVSLLAHVTVFGGAWLYARLSPPRTIVDRPIVAKLVQLGTPRSEKMLPRLPPPPSSPPSAAKPTMEQATHSPPPPTKPSTAPVPPAHTASTEKVTDAQARAEDALMHQKRLAEALAKLESPPTDGPTGKKPQEKVGQKDGSPVGDSDTAVEGDRYTALVVQALKQNFIVPTTISQQERVYLSCDLLIFIAADGNISRFSIDKSSGNAEYDRAVEATIQRTTLPAPPTSLKRLYGSDGLPVRFKP
jgi:TonB family protein